MTKKEAFIKIIDYCFENEFHFDEGFEEEYPLAIEFWKEFKENKSTTNTAKEMTDNGKNILAYMQENFETMNNIFTSKEIAEALFTSGRSVSGSMRKLVNDGYVEKVGNNPVQYALTDKGKNYKIDI